MFNQANRGVIGMTKLPASVGGNQVGKLSPLQVYMREVSKYPLLKPEEELELAKKHYDDDDVPSAHRLITSNLRLVVKIASDFRKAQVNFLDLIQEGNYGLMQAVKKYNPYKGVKLSSYAAWWIRAYILKYLLDNKSQVKIATTANQRKLFYNLRKETEKLLEQYDSVDASMLAETLDVPEKDVIEMQKRLASPDVSIDAPVKADSSATHGDLIQDPSINAADTLLAERQVHKIFSEHLEEFKETLNERDLEVFNLRIVAEEPETLQELGNRYGISRERARQIEARIISKLKKFVTDKGTLIEADIVDQDQK